MQKAFIQAYSEVLPQLHRWPRESQLYYGYGRINAYKALKALKDDLKPSQIIENEFSPKTPIPDGDLLGITSIIQIDDKGKIESVEAVSIDISHGNMPALKQLAGKSVQGNWKLKIIDKWTEDTGTLNRWGLKLKVGV